MDRDLDPTRVAPKRWVTALEEAEADVAAGRTVPAAKVHALLDEAIDKVEARLATRTG